MKKNIKHAFLASLLIVVAGCSQNTAINLKNKLDAIISTRPQIADTSFVLIKLSNDPLLASLKTVNGKQVVDPDQAKAVAAEQDKAIADLQNLSPDIKIIYRYKMVLNGLAISAPTSVLDKIKSIANVVTVEGAGSFERPKDVAADDPKKPTWHNIGEHNSVKFIGAEAAHQKGITGKGMRVGVIDTGIDYTHAMFGGVGTPEAYKAVDPSQANPIFPTKKVVGGTDLVGTSYNSESGNYLNRIPKPDPNPIDEAGHGTHVSGTIAGHGDGVNTYDGVAPDAQLYAIKVFGKEGSTSDSVVIAALEYAADPSQSGDPSDRLDVVNLSLGSGYGDPHVLYTQAITNLVKAGTSVVASAGNEGDTAYVVGAPSVAEDALSVAASIDDMDHNWKFRAVRFTTADQPEILTEAVESSMTKPIEQAGDVHGELVYAGLADQDFSADLKAKISGKVAFIDRGGVSFGDKIKRAVDAGAIGVVVANNAPGPALQMGGDGQFQIPAIMITLDLATQLKAEQQKGAVTIQFFTDKNIERPELIDTMAPFSSKGPRSLDALVKPEIAAPGYSIVSAKMGGGTQGTLMSGTSMAAPHMTGVLALLKQAHPNLSAVEIKALAVGTAKTMVDDKKVPYPVSRQGAGRIQVLQALDAKLIAQPVAVSLGETTVETQKVLRKNLTIKNITDQDLNLAVAFTGDAGITVDGPTALAIAKGESKVLSFKFTLNVSKLTAASDELDGMIKLSDSTGELLRVPVLAVVNKLAQVKVDSLKISSTSANDSAGAITQVSLSNPGVNSGDAYLFNFLAHDSRKNDPSHDSYRSKACDLSDVGYRVITRDGNQILQVAAKLYEPMTTWDDCEISVLIDGDGDGIPDQELVGTKQDHLKGLTKKVYSSILIDAAKARDLRKQFELDVTAGKPKVTENYTSAVVDLEQFTALDHSTIAIVEAPISALKLTGTGELSVKIAASYQEASAVEADDYLNDKWYKLNVSAQGQGFVDLPEKLSLAPGEIKSLEITKGAGAEKLMALFPNNRVVIGGSESDDQLQLVNGTYGALLTKK